MGKILVITKRIGLFIGIIATFANISRLLLLNTSHMDILKHSSVNSVFVFALIFTYSDELNIFKKSISRMKFDKEQLENKILQAEPNKSDCFLKKSKQ